jgi:MYXO-CTERM domain-containing protein
MTHVPTAYGCLIVLLAVAAAAGGAAAAPTPADGDLSVGDVRVEPGETAETAVALSTVPDGLSGYNVTVRVVDPSAATIVDASVPEAYSLSEARVVDGGAAAVLKAVDANEAVQPGDTAVPFGTVTLRGESPGETRLRVAVTQVDDDDGGRVRPTTVAGSVTVAEGTASPTTRDTPTTAPPATTAAPTTAPGGDTTAPDTGTAAPTTAPGATETTTWPAETTEDGDDAPVPGLGGPAALAALAVVALLGRRLRRR